MNRILTVALTLLGTSPLWAQVAPAPRTEAGELRLTLSNALVQEVRNGKFVKFSLKWAYLPETAAFRARMATDFGLWEGSKGGLWDEFTLTNTQLQDRSKLNRWFARELSRNQRHLLARAFLKGKYEGYKDQIDRMKLVAESTPPSPAEEATTILGIGYKEWGEDVLTGLGIQNGDTGTVPWFDYITARRDFFAMHYLLARAYGAGASVAFSPDPRGQNPIAVTTGLKWKLKIFPVSVDAGNPLYRFAVEAETPAISKTFSSLSPGDTANVDITVGLLSAEQEVAGRKYRRMVPVTIGKQFTTVEKQPFPGADEVEEIKSDLSPSVGSTTLSALTGTTPSGLLAPLFQNSSEAAPFVGALIGNGVSATTYGINYILTDRPDMNLGFVYGLVSNRDSAMFLGPSLQIGPFTAAVGGRIFNRKDESVSGALAGTLSIDLARLFSSRPKPTTIKPVPLQPGSQVWQDVDAIYRSTMLLPIGVTRVDASSIAQPVTVTQTSGPDGRSPATPFETIVPYSRAGEYASLILPRGNFLVVAPPDALIAEVDPDAYAKGSVPPDLEFLTELTYSNLPTTSQKVTPYAFFVKGRGYPIELSIGLPGTPVAGITLIRTKGPEGNISEPQRSRVPVVGKDDVVQKTWLATGTYVLRAPEGYEVSADGVGFAAEASFTVADPAASLPRMGDVGLLSEGSAAKEKVRLVVRKKG